MTRQLPDKAAQAASFGEAAAIYERGRPPYPDAALDWLLPDRARRVLDLGAGTGKLTRSLVARGLQVVAVEPAAQMLEQLSRAVPGVEALVGTAERIPVADDSVDTVVVAQAWHWVDVERAVPEVARVLTPGGRLALVWNVRDERVDWVARLGRIIDQGTDREHDSSNPSVGTPFGPVERFDVEWTHRITETELLDMVASRSYVILLDAERRETLLDEVRELVRTHPDLGDPEVIAMPYVTRCSRAELTS